MLAIETAVPCTQHFVSLLICAISGIVLTLFFGLYQVGDGKYMCTCKVLRCAPFETTEVHKILVGGSGNLHRSTRSDGGDNRTALGDYLLVSFSLCSYLSTHRCKHCEHADLRVLVSIFD